MSILKAYIFLPEGVGGVMIAVSATKLRNNLFEYLGRVSKGETIAIQRNGQQVAVIVPSKKENWRERITKKMKLMVPADEVLAPMEDIWEDYV